MVKGIGNVVQQSVVFNLPAIGGQRHHLIGWSTAIVIAAVQRVQLNKAYGGS